VTVGLVVATGGAQEVPEQEPAGKSGRPRVSVGVSLVGELVAREATEIGRDRVAARAYEIWVRNGRPEGTADRDWLQAEAELRAERAAGPGATDAGRVFRLPAAAAGPPPSQSSPPAAPARRGTVRLSGNVRRVTRSEWLGAPAVDAAGHIERSADLPEEVYRQIERSIAQGSVEGVVFLDGERRVDWFLDR
jgi:hypothetical protein